MEQLIQTDSGERVRLSAIGGVYVGDRNTVMFTWRDHEATDILKKCATSKEADSVLEKVCTLITDSPVIAF
jgi:hypothetical protein